MFEHCLVIGKSKKLFGELYKSKTALPSVLLLLLSESSPSHAQIFIRRSDAFRKAERSTLQLWLLPKNDVNFISLHFDPILLRI